MPTDPNNIDWIIEARTICVPLGDDREYLVVEVPDDPDFQGEPRYCKISYAQEEPGGQFWMTFDGEIVKTETFMSYVGYLDAFTMADEGEEPVCFHYPKDEDAEEDNSEEVRPWIRGPEPSGEA